MYRSVNIHFLLLLILWFNPNVFNASIGLVKENILSLKYQTFNYQFIHTSSKIEVRGQDFLFTTLYHLDLKI